MRNIRIATISLQLDEASSTPWVNVDRAETAVREACEKYAPDIVVLPELFDVVKLPSDTWRAHFGEEVPGDGPLQRRFSALAKEYKTHVVIDILEVCGEKLHNAAVLFGRDGAFVGRYRKTHLAPGEDDMITAGDEYPVFELDFGRVAMSICMDIHFPELFRIYALQGADIVVHPTMWIDYTGNYNESIANARAIDNGIYLVTSHFVQMPFLSGRSMGHSRIIDPMGRTRADTSHRPGVAVADVDLDETYEYWAEGDLKKRYPTLKDCYFKIRRPETYGILTRPDEENRWRVAEPELHRP